MRATSLDTREAPDRRKPFPAFPIVAQAGTRVLASGSRSETDHCGSRTRCVRTTVFTRCDHADVSIGRVPRSGQRCTVLTEGSEDPNAIAAEIEQLDATGLAWFAEGPGGTFTGTFEHAITMQLGSIPTRSGYAR